MNISQPSPRVSKVALLVGDVSRDRNQLSALKLALRELAQWPIDEVRELLEKLIGIDSSANASSLALETVLQALATRWQITSLSLHQRTSEVDELLAPLQRWYGQVQVDSPIRNYLLQMMAAGGSLESLERLAENIVDDPPEHDLSIGLAFAPLVSLPQPNYSVLFPRLLDGLQHLRLAAAILDIANHAFSERKISKHPAASRAVALHALLGNLVAKLSELEAGPNSGSHATARQMVAESVSLVVSLSRTLALVGDQVAVPNLKRALQIKHRRIRAEVAGALAQLGDPQGIAELIELAQWPVARLRALAYADELGLIERINPEYRTDVARAESQLATWLAEPTQFGVAPIQMELLEERELFWPGYDEAQACFLFRFFYPAAQSSWSNIGIAGPATHATSASLEHLSLDNIYALFAGWQTTHDEIYEIDLKHLSDRQKETIEAQQSRLAEQGYSEILAGFVGRFFGEELVIARATRDNHEGYLIWSNDESFWLDDPSQRITSDLAYNIFKGQKILASFNPDFGSEKTTSD